MVHGMHEGPEVVAGLTLHENQDRGPPGRFTLRGTSEGKKQPKDCECRDLVPMFSTRGGRILFSV